MAKQQMNLVEIEAMNSLQELTLEELDNVLGAGGGVIQTIVLSNQFYSDKTMVIVSHQLDIVNYVDSTIFVDKSSGDVIKDTHDNLIYRNQNYRKLFGLKEEVHND